ncbi:MAG: hypothetical protein OHK0011_22480 [Turneriella sp.]
MGQQPDDTTAFRLLSDFDLKTIAPDRNYLHQVTARMTPVHPASEKKSTLKEAYARDQELVRRSQPSGANQPERSPASAEYRWQVRAPGKDVLYLKPAREIFLPDRNRMFAVYIRGAGHAHQVYAILRGPNRIQQEIFIGSLDYQGWKRFEVVIPPYLQLRNPRRQNRYELFFLGLKVQSHFRDQPGTSVFNIAEMFVMADTSDKKIPGAAMPQEF